MDFQIKHTQIQREIEQVLGFRITYLFSVSSSAKIQACPVQISAQILHCSYLILNYLETIQLDVGLKSKKMKLNSCVLVFLGVGFGFAVGCFWFFPPDFLK